MVLNANFSNISAIPWREQILLLIREISQLKKLSVQQNGAILLMYLHSTFTPPFYNGTMNMSTRENVKIVVSYQSINTVKKNNM